MKREPHFEEFRQQNVDNSSRSQDVRGGYQNNRDRWNQGNSNRNQDSNRGPQNNSSQRNGGNQNWRSNNGSQGNRPSNSQVNNVRFHGELSQQEFNRGGTHTVPRSAWQAKHLLHRIAI